MSSLSAEENMAMVALYMSWDLDFVSNRID